MHNFFSECHMAEFIWNAFAVDSYNSMYPDMQRITLLHLVLILTMGTPNVDCLVIIG